MATLAEVRAQYPQYADLSDQQLADGLYRRFYSDMDRTEFDRKVGLEQETWGEYFKGLGREALQGATFDFADELGLTDREASEQFAAEHPVASTLARIGGGVAPFVAGPGAGLARLAVGSTLRGTIGRSAAVGAGAGGLAGLGAGEGDLGERLPGAVRGAGAGALFGAAVPPVISGIGGAARGIGRVVSPAAARMRGAVAGREGAPFPELPPRGGAPIEGARFVDDANISPSAEVQADQMIADQLLRSGRTAEDLQAALAEADRSRTLYGGGRSASLAQDTATLADLDEGLASMAGSAARASPEARRTIETFLQARQTGATPRGERALSPQAGLTTRQRMARREQGDRPAGQYERVHDAFKRALTLRDEDFHGHAGNPLRTEQQILKAARDEARPLYRAAYEAGEGVDLRPTIQPVLDKWAARMAEEPGPVAAAIRGALRLFETRAGTVSGIERFDKAKQFLDGLIERRFEAPEGRNRYLGGVLTELKNELLGAVDALPALGPAYARARAAFADRMTARDILTRFRDAWRDDADIVADDYAALASPEQQKLARLGLLWGFERQAGGRGRGRDITSVFDNPRIEELLSRIIPRTETPTGRVRMRGGAPVEYADRPERFGRLLEAERAQSRMRQRVVGGSPTAERLAADAAFNDMYDVINQFRSTPGILQLGLNYASRVLNRLFGFQADTAQAIAVRLFTAEPDARRRVLANIAMRMGRSRFERFSELMRDAQGRFSVLGGQAVAPAPPAEPSGPVNF